MTLVTQDHQPEWLSRAFAQNTAGQQIQAKQINKVARNDCWWVYDINFGSQEAGTAYKRCGQGFIELVLLRLVTQASLIER